VKRHLFNLLAALSLLLCMMTGALWVRSYTVSEGLFVRFWDDEWCSVGYNQGRLGFFQTNNMTLHAFRGSSPAWWSISWKQGRASKNAFDSLLPLPSPAVGVFHWGLSVKPSPTRSLMPGSFLGFNCGSAQFAGVTHIREIVAPFWSLLVFLGAVVASIKFRKPSPSKLGCCLVCGYDLRATPDRCPECGTIPKTLVKT